MKVRRLQNNIFAIVIPDAYRRSMVFLRVQEYSDSSKPKFRGHSFDILDFIDWYTMENGDFSYANDWEGFNVPYQIAIECYRKLPDKWVTKYDMEFLDCLRQISEQLNSLTKKAYIIGVDSLSSRTFRHEMSHAMYYMDPDYRSKTKTLLDQIQPKIYNRLRRNLLNMGYTDTVIETEIQAYLKTDWSHPEFKQGLSASTMKRLHKVFTQ